VTTSLSRFDWTKAPAAPNSTTVTINITSSCGTHWGSYAAPAVQLPVDSVSIPKDFVGFVESDGHLSIEAEHTTRNTAMDGTSYSTLPSHGRTLSDVTLMPVLAPSQPTGTGPVLEYDIFTFTSNSTASVTLLISPSQNQNDALRPLKYGVAFDAETPQTIQFVGNYTGGGYPPSWEGAVSDGVWGLSASGNTTTTLYNLSKTGKHTLKVWAVEPGVVFQRIVINLGGLRYSYLDPPESFRAGVDKLGVYDGTNFAGIQA
jgi:hypothetical protein